MGFVGDIAGKVGNMFGFGGGMNQYNATGANLDYTSFGSALQQAMQQRGGITNQQQGLASQLQAQSMGQGPSLAQPLLQQATNANQNMAAGEIGSQRGINPGLAGRLIATQRAGIQQNSAGQASVLRNQEQLGAQGMLGNVLGTMGQQNIGATSTLAGAQNAQNAGNIQNTLGPEAINAQAAQQNAQISAGAWGGLLKGISGVNLGGGGGGGGGGGDMLQQGADAFATMGIAHGGEIPGQAPQPGDSSANDLVHAMLSPHEIVLPRSVTLADDAPERAKKFVEAIKGKLKPEVQKEIDGGGMPLTRTQMRMGEIEEQAMAEGGEVAATDPSTGAPLESQSADPLSPLRFAIGQDLPPDPVSPPAAQGVPPGIAAPPDEAPPVQSQPPMPMAPKPPSLGSSGEMAAGEKQTIHGIEMQQTGAEGFAKAQTGLMDEWNGKREQMMAKFQADAQAHQKNADAMFQSLLDPKNDINPNRFWEQKSTGGKIAASIGIILGGIGSGVAGGTNPALDQINKAIDRDVEAQKLNIGKKANALSQYMQQGRDMQQAHILATADMKDAAAAQLARAATAYQGTKAAADAQVSIGMLRQDAAAKRAQVMALDFQNQMSRLNYDFMQRMMTHANGQGGNFARDMQTMGFLKNPEKFAETDVSADKDVSTGAVDQKTGQPLTQTATDHFRAKSPQAMEKASEALGHNRVMDTSLKELESFEKDNPLGGTPGSEAVGRARAAVQTIRMNYEATLAGMNRQASPEVMKHMEDIAKDPTVLFKSGKTQGALKFLRKMVNEHKQNILDTYTLGPQ